MFPFLSVSVFIAPLFLIRSFVRYLLDRSFLVLHALLQN